MTRRSAIALAALLQALACSSKETHGPYASKDCTGSSCASAATVAGGGGGASGAGGSAVRDSGIAVVPDANTAAGFTQCTADPTTHTTLCIASTLCPGLQVDPAVFPGCGYVSTASSPTIGCLCNGNQLCPVGIGLTCPGLTARLAPPHTVAEICLQLSTGNCQDLGATLPTGSGGAVAQCDQGCALRCNGAAPCIRACGC